jgi:hypothetical protein
MPAHRRWWVGVVSFLFLASATAGELHDIPGPAHRGDFVNGHDFRMTPVVAVDASGRPITDMPAYRLGYRDTDGNWQEQGPETPVDIAIPADVRDRLMLVFTGAWALMPRGWRPSMVMLTSNSTMGIEFDAPGGSAHGWLFDGMVLSAWSAMEEAAPFFPHVRKEMLANDMAQPGQRFAMREHVISLSHPDACTAIYDYVEKDSPLVHAWMNFVGIENGELYTFAIDMPESDKRLRDAVFASHTTAQGPCPSSRQQAGP